MKYTKLSAAAALTAGSALFLSACAPSGPAGGGNGDGDQAGGATEVVKTGDFGEKYTVDPGDNTGLVDMGDVTPQPGNVQYSVGADEFSSYNGAQSNTYTTYNSAVVDRMFSSFWYYGTDGAIIRNEEFGTYEKISDDPLQVKYTIADDAKWSDGTDITAGDYILDWAVNNSSITAEGSENPLFDSVSSTMGDYVPEAPEGDVNGKEFTITYKEPYADWEILVGSTLPAHIVAEQAGMSMEDLAAAVREKDAEALAPAAEFWNDGWDMQPGELLDPALTPSSGPYTFKEGGWTAGQFITLTANENFFGQKPATQDLIIRFAAADSHVQALQNKELDVIEPQATVDTLDQLKGLGDSVVVQTGDTLTWEHLDFNRGEGSVFADSPELREAFALCVPRQRIVDNLIKPINPDAQVMNAREVFPFQENYQEVVDYAYPADKMDNPDQERAKQLVEESGVDKPTVRLGYQSGNPRRTDITSLIQSSCNEVGFDIQDAGSSTFFTQELGNGDFDVALFAWSGSGQKASGRNIYHTTGGQNDMSYSNPDVDAAWDKVAGSLDEAQQLEGIKDVEKFLWEDFQAIPLFAHPGVLGQNADVANVRKTTTQSGALWNIEQWVRVENTAE